MRWSLILCKDMEQEMLILYPDTCATNTYLLDFEKYFDYGSSDVVWGELRTRNIEGTLVKNFQSMYKK